MRVRPAFLLPLVLVVLVLATHFGRRSPAYRLSRPDDARGAWHYLPADGYGELEEGVPVAADAGYTRHLAGVFRGEPGKDAGTPVDERALVPFLQALLGSGTVSALWPGVLVNLLATLAATACTVDLVLRRGRSARQAAVAGGLFAAGRGIACYLATPDSHLLSFAWMPIGAWLFEALELRDPRAPWKNALVLGLALGAALLTYLGTISLLAFVWLWGLGRTPLRRLLAITVVALAVKAGWHVVGGLDGIPFHRIHGSDIREGLVRFLGHVAGLAGAERAEHGHALAGILGDPVLPAFGVPLLGLAALGLVVAPREEKRLGLALALPAYVAALPHLTYWGNSPGWIYPASFGLALLAAEGVDFVARGADRVARSPRAGHAVALLLVLAFALVESSDLFGWPCWPFLDAYARP